MRNRPLVTKLLALWLLLPSCSRQEAAHTGSAPSPLPSAKVRVRNVESRQYAVLEDAVGTVRAKLQARIEAKIAGRIDKMLVAPGSRVTAGETLVRLDVREIRAKLDQALALRAQADGDLRRTRLLVQKGAGTQAELEAAQARAGVAEGSVREAETMLGYADIVAPFSGVVTRKLADVGDLAAPGRPLLELEDPTQLRFEADVSEASIGTLSMGAKISVRVDSVAEALEATVSELAPTADPGSRTFRIKLDLPSVEGLRAGQFGRAAIPVGSGASLRVPSAAVVRRGQLEMVFVAVSHQARMRLVRTGKKIGSEIEIVAGLDAGDSIVVDAAAGLIDGQPLEVQP